ncbi:hypothetical protein JHK86_022648 [Glycine max]|nr:hypothetical protein JHK86_022648 [Glycine max]
MRKRGGIINMVQKAINEGKLKFEEKPMKVDIDPFHIQGNYVEPMQIMMIGASIGTSKVSIPPSKEEVNQALEEFEKKNKKIPFFHSQENH